MTPYCFIANGIEIRVWARTPHQARIVAGLHIAAIALSAKA